MSERKRKSFTSQHKVKVALDAIRGRTFDIGGPEVLTYREMMERLARIEGRKLYILPLQVLTPKLSSYWVGFIRRYHHRCQCL